MSTREEEENNKKKSRPHTRLIKNLDVVCTREVDENVTTKLERGLSRMYTCQSLVFFNVLHY